jgi:outer membrane lipoprotein LolB
LLARLGSLLIPGLVCCFLGACSTTRTAPDHAIEWNLHQDANSQLSQWKLQGKIGVKTSSKASSAYFNWTQADGDYHILLNGPLGQGATHIEGGEGHASLLQRGKPPRVSQSPEALIEQELGWHIPVSELFWWIRGLPAPNDQTVTVLNELGLLDELQQSGWQVNFSRYQQVNSYRLPGKLVMQRPELRVTLLISRWQPDEQP